MASGVLQIRHLLTVRQIIATAIPKITTTFNAVDDVGWYGASYLVTTTALQPTFGKVFQYFDVKWVYVSALVVFECRYRDGILLDLADLLQWALLSVQSHQPR